MFHEAKGKSLREARDKRELEHLTIFAHPDATHEEPAWIVRHSFAGPAHEDEEHFFLDHGQMLDHVARHSGTEPIEEETETEDGGTY